MPDDGWAEAIGRLVEKPRERRKLAKRARKWGREQSMSANVGLWEQALADTIVRNGGTPRPARPAAQAERGADPIDAVNCQRRR